MQEISSTYPPEASPIKIKICGMGAPENILDVASLNPDYLGFIFYPDSPRNFETEIPELPGSIKKTGVFVDASLEFILNKVEQYNFQALQLHGKESAEFCKVLRNSLKQRDAASEIEIIKVFSVKDEFNFSRLKGYEGQVDFFLFDTKGKNKGGNGYTFDWKILKDYPSTTPFFLSGGIGLEELESIRKFISVFHKNGKEHLLYAVDINSKFELAPGEKNIEDLNKFSNSLKGLQPI